MSIKCMSSSATALALLCINFSALADSHDTTSAAKSSAIPEFIFSANQIDHNLSAYQLDLQTGGLQPLQGSPFKTGRFPVSAAVTPNGHFVYVSNQGSDNISAFALDKEHNTLTPLAGSPFAAGHFPDSITV